MNTYVKLFAVTVLLAGLAFQVGCDRSETITGTDDSQAVVGKRSSPTDLGERLADDPEFGTLRRILYDADLRARLKYLAGANLKQDLAFARTAEKKRQLSASDKSRLAAIRGLSLSEFHQVHDLRKTLLARYPEIRELSEEELQDILIGAGVGKTRAVGKMLDKCSDCYYAYNTCISTAEFRHAVETMSCILLVETLFGGTACYLASLTKYLWTVSSCGTTKQYCLNSNDCLATSVMDTL